ncbi:uncharacterized protein LOC128554561 [Mercenaria mercenaria]|uniref:uncharacterized protein LOC128554561 n=1 Tax=Mercenaria mercenaria TaxID=6596 RepID=UPI00234F9E24|nr:uncharacterized protein LOC128554561 [Mercenaria mercenaria]
MTTKRLILQNTSRIYDPLGLLSPVTVKAKIFLQEIWKQKYDWDTSLPTELQQKWITIASDLNSATQTKKSIVADDTYHLHIFVDSSSQAHGSTAYICKGNQSMLIMTKNRVAPLKQLTLPKLELMAAITGARMSQHLRQTLESIQQKTYYWSDSQIVLHWLGSKEATNRFVRARVTEIKKITGNATWRYCPTH